VQLEVFTGQHALYDWRTQIQHLLHILAGLLRNQILEVFLPSLSLDVFVEVGFVTLLEYLVVRLVFEVFVVLDHLAWVV